LKGRSLKLSENLLHEDKSDRFFIQYQNLHSNFICEVKVIFQRIAKCAFVRQVRREKEFSRSYARIAISSKLKN